MELSDFYNGLERDPDERQYIVQAMTVLVAEERDR
jgi:hypothetical protein